MLKSFGKELMRWRRANEMKERLFDRIMKILKEKGKMRMSDLIEKILSTKYYPSMRIHGYILALIDLGYIGYEREGDIIYYIKGE